VGKKKAELRYVADLRRLELTQAQARRLQARATPILISVLFLGLTAVAVIGGRGMVPASLPLLVAAVTGGYMALNIGANDVANNMGPAVGGRVLTIAGAVTIAAICEAAGAFIAGGDVVQTIANGIIHAQSGISASDFILLMISALLAGALWINLATVLGAPVSTTHSIVGGILGAGIAAAGTGIVAWPTLGAIASSWVISPIIGGLLSAAMLAVIKALIFDKDDRQAAARRWVPPLISLMVGAFTTYLCLLGLSKVLPISGGMALALGLAAFALSLAFTIPFVRNRLTRLGNRKKDIRTLFHLPLIMGAGLLSFAHGANDVANAIGPLAAIASLSDGGSMGNAEVTIPFWVMFIGAVGISLGLALFGPKLIQTVGDKITRLNPVRAYCVVFSSAATVLVASWLGLPVSSTHIAIGAIFGIGFLREFIEDPRRRKKSRDTMVNATPEDALREGTVRQKRMLVRRRFLLTIASAWVITVPAAALLSAGLYLVISRF
jgi:PiT family inorganic phosphate transporter